MITIGKNTHLIGLPVILAPFFSAFIVKFSQIKVAVQDKNARWIIQEMLRPNVMIALGGLGCGAFFIYCAQYFGSWHLYFDMERVHWSGTADPLFLFQLSTWVPPPWGYDLDWAPALPNAWSKILFFDFFRMASYSFSEMLVPIFMWMEIGFLFWIFKKLRSIDEKTVTWFLAGLLILLGTCFSLATRHYESMSRCLLPVWILLVISDVLNPNGSFFLSMIQLKFQRFIVIGLLLISLGFWIQLLNRFFIGWWVA